MGESVDLIYSIFHRTITEILGQHSFVDLLFHCHQVRGSRVFTPHNPNLAYDFFNTFYVRVQVLVT